MKYFEGDLVRATNLNGLKEDFGYENHHIYVACHRVISQE